MPIIKSKQTTNSIFPSKKICSIDIYDKSTENITLEYFSIVNKIFNNSLEKYYNYPVEKKVSSFNRNFTLLSQENLGFTKEKFEKKSFFGKVFFLFSITKEELKKSKIDTVIESLNKTKILVDKLLQARKELTYPNDVEHGEEYQDYKESIIHFLNKYPEYKQLKDEFDRLHDERVNKIEQMNQLVLELNNYRQFILDEYNSIVLKLIDASKEFETDIKIQYMDLVKKLYQKIDYKFNSTSSKEIVKSDVLYKWDELKNNVEVLEKDNQSLDIEISKIIDNHFFINFKNKDFKYFKLIKTKLASMIKENEEKTESQNKKSSYKEESEDIINSVDEKERIREEKKINKEIQLQKSKLEKLKKELKALEDRFQNLCEQKTEYLNDIEEFNREYNLHLGVLIKDILNLKKEILYKQTIKQQKEKEKYQEDINIFEDTKETIDELKSTISEIEEALESIDKDDENYEEISNAYDELKEELKKLEDELELQEEELEKTKEFIDDESIEQEYKEFEYEYEHIKESFVETLKLNDAYSKKDISKVKEILHSLQNGSSFEVSSETIEDKELLKEKIKEYKQSIKDIEKEIEEIKEDVTYQTILEIDDWDEYFKNLKNDLQNEKEILENEARETISLDKSIFIQWAKDNDIKFENTTVLTATNKQLETIPNEIVLYNDFESIYLNRNKLEDLPENIIELTDLKRLNLSENYKLLLTDKQKEWIVKLQKNGCNITIDNDLLSRTKQTIEDKYNLYKNDMPYLNNILRWAFDNNIDTIISQKDTLENVEILNLNNLSLEFIPKDIAKLSNLKELKLWNNKLTELPEEISEMTSLEKLNLSDNNMVKLPKNITNLKLKKLQLLDNKSLILTSEQKQWIKELKSSNYDLEYDKDLIVRKETKTKYVSKKTGLNIVKKKKEKTISKESSSYSKHIQSIENIKFERIRKYCENLSKENSADTMQKYLAENGRMYKALMYSTLEVLMENLNEATITLYDWGCSQGIASMLVLDYIKEKQLDIKLSEIVLIDDDTKALSHAISQVEALAQDSIKFTTIKSDDNKILDTIESSKNNIIVNLFANDKIPENFLDIEYEIFDESYFLCVSNEDKEFVDEVYQNIHNAMDTQNMSILDGKIGRYSKYERIFKAEFCEIPF